jgi:hypothetical protein
MLFYVMLCAQGQASAQLMQVGNAVPFLMGWAIMGSVYLAAYGVDPPRPDFLRRLQIVAGLPSGVESLVAQSADSARQPGMQHVPLEL